MSGYRYSVVGVWHAGSPTNLSVHDTYGGALEAYAAAKQRRIPFVGIADNEDPERGYGPWDDEDEDSGENPAYGPGNPDWERDFDKSLD